MYIYNDIINEKIELLQGFCILSEDDIPQETTIRNILAKCKSEIQMEQKLYNVLRGNETITDLIKREYMN